MNIDKHIVRSAFLYEFKLGTKVTSTFEKVNKAFGQSTTSLRTVQYWYEKFKNGNYDLSDAPKSGRPVTVSDSDLLALVESDPQVTCAILGEQLGLSAEGVRKRLHSLNKVYRLNKWVPHDLSIDQKASRKSIAFSLLLKEQNDPFLDRLMTSDEKWIYFDNTERSYAWLDKGQPSCSTPKPSIHRKKVMLCIWWCPKGVVFWELLPDGQSINGELYVRQLTKVNAALTDKWPALVNRSKVIYQHDNARPHIAKVVKEKLTDLKWEVIPHPPYSPDLAPSDYHLFLSMSNAFKGQKFTNRDEVHRAVTNFLEVKGYQFCADGIKKLKERWVKTVDCNGDYFD